jgi:hypothetical protein
MVELNITNITVNYHRNGVCGEGFDAINFHSNTQGEDYYNGDLIAIVPSEELEVGKTWNGRCYVIKPSNNLCCYRGDNFEHSMREIVKAHGIMWRIQLNNHIKSGKPYDPENDPSITRFKDMDAVRAVNNGLIEDDGSTKKKGNKRFEILDI